MSKHTKNPEPKGTDEAVKYYLSFRVGHQWYGVDVDDILEVMHFMTLAELPGTPPDVLGLLTFRGEIMPVIDLRIRFGAGDAGLRLDTPIIGIHTPEGPLGLVVDDADDVEEVALSQISAQTRTASPYVTSVARLADRLLLLLDTELLRAQTRLGAAEAVVKAGEPAGAPSNEP
ncbi:MAG: purine-binding chemotaxis protein CheW [Anaerolineae bacterium]|nr:purine-binding chemotaxis protein CheW [Anaerolineae bacterium]